MVPDFRALVLALVLPAWAVAQAASPAFPGTQPAEPVQGTVLFQSHGEPPPPAKEPADPNRRLLPAAAQETGGPTAQTSELTDAERGALLFTGYDLDVRLAPAAGGLTARARVTFRNTGDAPLRYVGLQISSSLRWESITLAGASGTGRVAFAQHALDTDADHTGKASEAVLTLPAPLAPGRSLTLDTFYSGTVTPSAERLVRLGAAEGAAAATDWDTIAPGGVFLRGFGNVLWYPVSAPQLFLGEGTRLFDAVDQTRFAGQTATVHLRVSVAYTGDPPAAAYFCGRRAALTAVSDTPDAPTALAAGVATGEFAAEPLGFRLPSLFVVERPEALSGALPGELAGGRPMLAVESDEPVAAPALASAAETVAPLLQKWLGALPLSALTVLDPPRGDALSATPHSGPGELPRPFEDGPLLLASPASLTTSDSGPALTFSLTHAWVQSGRPWLDEGLAQFFALLTIEQAQGRDAMTAQLAELLKPVVAAASPSASGPAAPQPLVAARSEVFYRRKAAAVWLMLRGIVGEQALEVTLQAWRMRGPAGTTAEQDALVLEGMLEKNSGKDLRRFFADWVLADRGLPELSVSEVVPRQLPVTENGHNGGWLTVVTVQNAGGAMADVPVIVSSGSFSTTVRMQVPGAGSGGPGSATVRVQTETAPTDVQVNDGATPELRTAVHRRAVRTR